MGSRERHRAARHKRKRQLAEQRRERLAASELKNEQARQALEPLREGERPGTVTIGAIVAAVVAVIFIASAVVAAVGDVEVGGETPNPLSLAAFGAAMSAMSIGMWRARYWAVLGFQALLVLFMLAAAAGLLSAVTVLQGIGTLAVLALSGTLFYFMIRAMARIQMPRPRH